MVTRQTSRLELSPISPFAVVALVATTLCVEVDCNDRRGNRFRVDHCVLNGCRF
jgi:hypothetical protein